MSDGQHLDDPFELRARLAEYAGQFGPLFSWADVDLILEAAVLLRDYAVPTKPMDTRWSPLIPLANRLAALLPERALAPKPIPQ